MRETVVLALTLALPAAAVAAGDYGVAPLEGDHFANAVDYPTLCTGDDWIVFNGTSESDGKMVSVCMTKAEGATPNHLTFRYGRPGRIDLIYPARAEGSFDDFTVRRYTRPQTTYMKFEMTTDGLNYEIITGGEGNEYAASLQVVRVADGALITDDELTVTTPHFRFMLLEDIVKVAPFDE